MDKIPIIDQIRRNDNLLSLPQVLSEVLEEVGKEDFTADSLASIILKDPSLTSRILRMANSSYYHRLSDIKTVNQAVSVLGVTTVKCLALSSSVFNPDKIARESGVDPKEFFAYVLSIASASERIARAVSYEAPEEAFIAGLLHDIGVMFLLYHHPQEYSRALKGEVGAKTLVEAETSTFGADHCEIGSHLAETWNLPSYVSDCIACHHHIGRINEKSILQNVVALAVLLTSDRFSGYEMGLEERLRLISQVPDRLSLSKSQIDEISSSLLARTIDAAEYLGVDIGNIENMLVRANQEIWKSYLTIENLFKERQELSENLLREEHSRGAMEAKNIALATLSHYLNNATMVIYGRTQLIRMVLKKGDTECLLEKLPADMDVMDKSVEKIVAVLEEMREISPLDQKEFYNMSQALNIDDRIKQRLEKMSQEGTWVEMAEKAPA